MKKVRSVFVYLAAVVLALTLEVLPGLRIPAAAAQDQGQSAIARRIGAIKSINGNALTLSQDSGPDVTVTIAPSARLLRIAPGAKDLKEATPIQLQDLQVGDRVRVRGQAAGEGVNALEVIAMARTDLDAKRQQEQQDWQKRGTGGLVSAVDPGAATVTISVTSLGGKKQIAIHTTKTTIFRRYAEDSVKFDDAKPSTLAEIHAGDQLRARGDKNADGSEITADEIVSGSFRNVAGTVNSVDASAGTLSVQDLLTKKQILVKISRESQLHKLPPEMAQMIAMRLKGTVPAGIPGAGGNRAPSGTALAGAGPGGATAGGMGQGGANGGGMGAGGGMRRGGGDFQQVLNRMPAVTLADLHKGDAVLIVATQGSATGATAITLLSGVEPILQAAPSQAMMLTPWSLGGSQAADAMQQ